MSGTPLISVIVPVYKVEAYLDRCVQSIVDQTYTNLEIILVDDGSPDRCPQMCDDWAARDTRICVIHKKNGGISSARNAGLEKASGRWVVFVDSDDTVSKYLIASLMNANTEEGVLSVGQMVRFSGEHPNDIEPIAVLDVGEKDISSLRSGMYCWAILYDRMLIKQIGICFDANLRNLEDVAWNAIYLRYIRKVRFIPTPLYYYRYNAASITSRCIDRVWQMNSWTKARESVLRWFCEEKLSRQQAKELKEFFRHCQNNVFGECVAGDISFEKYQEQCITHLLSAHMNKEIGVEYKWQNSYIYFFCYTTLMKIRNILLDWKRKK